MKNIRIILLILTVVAVGLLSPTVSLPAFAKANGVLLLALCVLVWIFLEIWNHNPTFQLGVLSAAKSGALGRFVLVVLAGLMIVALVSGIVWFALHQAVSAGNVTKFPLPTPNPQAVPVLNITEFPLPRGPGGGGITAGPDGNLWFSELGGNKIGRINPSGMVTEFPLPTPNSWPEGITTGPDSNLWFTERQSNQIGRISLSGTVTEFPLPTPQSGPTEITKGSDGNLWFTENSGIGPYKSANDKIGRISPNGTIIEFPLHTSRNEPGSITAGPDGNLWFTENRFFENDYSTDNKIGRISPNGIITEFPFSTSHPELEEITAGPDGNLWFTEFASANPRKVSDNVVQ